LSNTVSQQGLHSFIHSGHFYSGPSSPLLLGGTPDYSTDTVESYRLDQGATMSQGL